jgi:hypothetical protein
MRGGAFERRRRDTPHPVGADLTPELIVHLSGWNGRGFQERFDVLRIAEGPTDVVLPSETEVHPVVRCHRYALLRALRECKEVAKFARGGGV